jgi:hypothetical protein
LRRGTHITTLGILLCRKHVFLMFGIRSCRTGFSKTTTVEDLIQSVSVVHFRKGLETGLPKIPANLVAQLPIAIRTHHSKWKRQCRL